MSARPRVIVLRASGSNCDREAVAAWRHAGADCDLVHINELLRGDRRLEDYHVLTIPGGFTYGDDLGAGRLLANDLRFRLRDQVERFVQDDRLVLGICNGFQVLVKSGLLPDATLYLNDSGQFECRWIHLKNVNRGSCPWVEGLGIMYLPVAHGEGKFIPRNQAVLDEMGREDRIVFQYVDSKGELVDYPGSPAGSVANVGGVCDRSGRILGLMPHPERHFLCHQHPRWLRRDAGQAGDGLALFENALRHLGVTSPVGRARNPEEGG
jgi:phosphoribosylformylglycinamidine synthase I